MTGTQNIRKDEPLVSVCVITYNHGLYIRDCLEGIFCQQTDFHFEVCVGEDGSTDDTLAICREYEARFPDQMRLFHRDRETFKAERSRYRAPFIYNHLQTYAACRGKYIAMCEGDDYWTDPRKLQKQADFLEANPDYSMCFTNAQRKVNGVLLPEAILDQTEAKPASGMADILDHNFIPTCTAVIRRDMLQLPPWALQLSHGDWIQWALLALKGPIGCLDEVTAVYRWHGAGAWGGASPVKMYRSAIETYECFHKHFPAEYHPLIARRRYEMMHRCAEELARKGGNKAEAWQLFQDSFSKMAGRMPWFELFKPLFWLMMPVQLLRKIKRAVVK